MIGFRGLTALALACAASALACGSSSSGGTPTKFACASNGPSSMDMNQACISCVESNCNSQFTTAFGSSYSSLDITGGSCGSYFACIAGCACNDTACFMKCGTSGVPSSDCQTAETAATMCEGNKCASTCGTTSTTGGDDGGGTGVGTGTTEACSLSSSGLCIEGVPSSACTSMNGTAQSSCPAANLVGCCTTSGIKSCFYPPETASTAMMICTDTMGTFSTGM